MKRGAIAILPLALLAACATHRAVPVGTAPAAPITLSLAAPAEAPVTATYRLAAPTPALHFAQALGGYRAAAWMPDAPGFRWVTEGDGERIERIDGRPFDRIAFSISPRYRELPKYYAPFSPFSEGSLLIHSGQFHACLAAPCDGQGPLPIAIEAPGRFIDVTARRVADRAAFASHIEGTSIFVGTLAPVATDDFVAIVDPGLSPALHGQLAASLPASMRYFTAIYGPLATKPALYVSLDRFPKANAGFSSQGGTLPDQIFMHLYGDGWGRGIDPGTTLWLDWFFAHEAAHLFQRAGSGSEGAENDESWVHEGGADAMAALALARRGDAEKAYVRERLEKARAACTAGLTKRPLGQASDYGEFDLHYQCGALIALALGGDIVAASGGKADLHTLNQRLFARVRAGEPFGRRTYLSAAAELGATPALLATIAAIVDTPLADPKAAVDALVAAQNRARPPR